MLFDLPPDLSRVSAQLPPVDANLAEWLLAEAGKLAELRGWPPRTLSLAQRGLRILAAAAGPAAGGPSGGNVNSIRTFLTDAGGRYSTLRQVTRDDVARWVASQPGRSRSRSRSRDTSTRAAYWSP